MTMGVNNMISENVVGNQRGIVLVAGLMFLALLTILAATAYLLSTTDVKISANYKHSEEAFNQAEAGVQYGIAVIQNGLEAGTFSVPTLTGSGNAVALPSSSHADFSFSLSSMEKMGNNSYKFISTGTGTQGATARVNVTVKRGSEFELGVFADTLLDLDQSSGYYSYNSNDISNPTPGDSTGQGDIGSNGTINAGSASNGIIVDGDVVFGNDGTADAAYYNPAKPVQTVNGEDGAYVGEIDADPLNLTGGVLTADVEAHFATNDNLLVASGLTGTNLNNGIINQPGDYFFTEITGNLTLNPSSPK